METRPFLGLPLTRGMGIKDVCALIDPGGDGRFISFINPAAWYLIRKCPEYLDALRQMDFVLPDGQGVAFACRKLTGDFCPRVSFDMSSLAGPFFEKLKSCNKSVILVGAAPGVAEQVRTKLALEYPRLKVLKACDGFGALEEKAAEVMRLRPDAVVVGMGAPRQEQLLALLKNMSYEGVALTCGGFFDQYLEASEYYPPLIDRLQLRFAYRVYQEPRRLWRRYLIEYQWFIFAFLRAALKKIGRIEKDVGTV